MKNKKVYKRTVNKIIVPITTPTPIKVSIFPPFFDNYIVFKNESQTLTGQKILFMVK